MPPTLDERLQPLIRQQRLGEALALGRTYLAEHPDDHEGLFRVGLLEAAMGRFEEAYGRFSTLIAKGGDGQAEAHFNCGRIHGLHGQFEQAQHHYEEAVRLRPVFAEAWSTLATVLRRRGLLDQARSAYKRAMELCPNLSDPRLHLVPAQLSAESARTACEGFEREMHSNLLFLQSYHVLCEPDAMLAAHRAWDKRHGRMGRAGAYVHPRPQDAAPRRLRIGYVSPDFRQHSVSYFFLPILAAHDRSTVEIVCYAELSQPDAVSQRIRELADGWVVTTGLDDRALARRIHDDRIDILVDLAGHTANNRLGAFTFKPAPIQATYLGYFTTTGLATMDYWISDAVLTPPDSVEQTSETIIRLPRCCLVYEPPAEAPDIQPRPPRSTVTFGCFNDLSKVGAKAITLWASVLQACPMSRMVIKARQLGDTTERQRLAEAFARQGIARERLELIGPTPGIVDHLAHYANIDIALDTIPRTGGTTSAEALWMGVPVITLAGPRYIERLSATMLAACGLDDLVTTDHNAYIARAVSLANDADERERLRATLRQRMAQSPLLDGRGLARTLESAYSEMWRRWVAA